MSDKNLNKISKRGKALRIIIFFIVSFVIFTATINAYVVLYGSRYIISNNSGTSYDCIIILGTRVIGDEPGELLKDRLDKGTEVFNEGCSETLLMSGNGISENYDETTVMYTYAVNKGINKIHIKTDPAGLTTYESLYRAKKILGVKKILIVTQRYHLYRAVYIARSLGIDAYGAAADYNTTPSNLVYQAIRETGARIKSFIYVITVPRPQYMDEIPIS